MAFYSKLIWEEMIPHCQLQLSTIIALKRNLAVWLTSAATASLNII